MAQMQEKAQHITYSEFQAQALFDQAAVALGGPMPQAVRAAVYQVLASVPGVRIKAGVTDLDGRSATALGLASHPGNVIIVDPATGMMLGFEFLATQADGVYAPGTQTQYTLSEGTGWTNQLPRP